MKDLRGESISFIFSASSDLLWWSISCVNLTGLRDSGIAGKTLFLSVSVKVFPEEIII